MPKKEKFNKASLKNIADAFGYDIDEENGKRRLLRKDSRFQVHIESINDDTSVIYLVLKLFSFDFPGDRTDFTDVSSILFIAFLRIIDYYSFSTIDIDHPVLDERSSIYGRLMSFEQPNRFVCDNEILQEKLSEILYAIKLFSSWVSPIQTKMEHATNYLADNMSFDEWGVISNEISLRHFDKSDGYNIIHRESPSWYYSNFFGEMSIVLCPELAQELKKLYQSSYKAKLISGVNSKLHLSESIKNAMSDDIVNTAYDIVSSFEKENDPDIQYIPTENSLILFSDNHIASFRCSCGLQQFEYERARIDDRHKLEHELLFPVNNITWSESIKASEFEDFILELIKKEDGVFWARKVGNTNSPDGGRDIICEWYILKNQIDNENESPFEKIKVIVQCKAFKKSVGKSHVTDIRDMLEHYNAEGFLLATSSQITTPLMDHLNSLKRTYWVDWWTRSELEDRVNKHQEIISSFPDILTIS